MDIQGYWKAVLEQDQENIRPYFHPDAYVRWHNTNEEFNVDEFIVANCEYPGSWRGEIKRIENSKELIITVTHVYSVDGSLSFHVTSFMQLKEDKVYLMDEYWGEDGEAPEWRKEKQIGKPILILPI